MSGLRNYWAQLSARDRRVLQLGGLATLVILFYALAWLPVQDGLDRLRPQVERQQEDLAWLQAQAEKVQRLRKQSGSTSSSQSSVPVLTAIDQVARARKIRDRIRQMQPGKEADTARVWFEKVVFEDWLSWLDALTRQGMVMERVSVTKSADEPLVNIRVELVRR
jgi:general secretion pathway protein M